MKNNVSFLLLIICGCISTSVTAQFYNAFNNSNIFERETSAIPLGNGFVFGYTSTNSHQNFHEEILLVKTNNTGSIVWSKQYDAGTGTSLHLIEMINAINNEILVSCIISLDNNFGTAQRCLLKLNTSGAVVWCKKYTGGNPFDYKGLVQLKDSSFVLSTMAGQLNPGILQVNENGKLMGAVKITNRQFISIHGITATGNAADIIVGNNNRVNINFKTHAITAQQQYNTSNQFTALLSTRCKNGDIIYLAGRTSGGVLSGTSRIFRTSANGNLVWAKNITAYYNASGSPSSLFDIVQQVYVHEDINGNIIACVMEESTQELIIVFDANGKYLYNRTLSAPLSFIAETNAGTYLNTTPPSVSTSTKTIFANRFLSATSGCDFSIIVNITAGTDSSATLNKLLFATAKFTTTDIPVMVQNVSMQQSVFCNNAFAVNKNNNDKEMHISIAPDPAIHSIIIQAAYNLPCHIYDMNGILKITSATNHTIDIAALQPGIYTAAVMAKDKIIRKTFIKQ
jgi:hypothetical protein